MFQYFFLHFFKIFIWIWYNIGQNHALNKRYDKGQIVVIFLKIWPSIKNYMKYLVKTFPNTKQTVIPLRTTMNNALFWPTLKTHFVIWIWYNIGQNHALNKKYDKGQILFTFLKKWPLVKNYVKYLVKTFPNTKTNCYLTKGHYE